jgi:signal transduction histidine kinase
MMLPGKGMARELAEERQVFLSTLPAGRGERRLAVAVVLVSAAAFSILAPVATVRLSPVWAFIPAYQSALVVNDLITALLLFGQFAILRSRALLVLAGGYLFTALMAAAHALTFPGLFSSSGLLGAGPQTTAWLYMFWHGGFPIVVGAYALLKGERRRATPPTWHFSAAVLSVGAAVLAAVGGLTLLATRGQNALPAIMQGSRYTPAMITVVSSVWALSLLALGILWRRRPHSVLDVWLMVVMSAWLFDIALSAVLNGGRFDLGFYAGRVYGLLAASFVLAVLLVEHGRLYARLADAHESERRERQLVQLRTAELSAVNEDLEAFSYSVSHDLQAPLRAMQGFAEALLEDYGPRLDSTGHDYAQRIVTASRHMDALIQDLLAYSRLGRADIALHPVSLEGVVDEACGPLETALKARGGAIVVERPLGRVLAHRAVLGQIVTNLLTNALKFTRPDTPPRIHVRSETATGRVRLWVEDNGIGIAPEHRERIFRAFERLHGGQQYPGTGIGLAIVQKGAVRLGGRAGVESEVGAGSRFWVELREAKVEDENVRPAVARR